MSALRNTLLFTYVYSPVTKQHWGEIMKTMVMCILCICSMAWTTLITWTPDSTIKIDSTVRLSQGDSLLIQPGTTVLFDSLGEIIIDTNAILISKGTFENPITLDVNPNGGKAWKGIHVRTGLAEIQHVKIKNARWGILTTNENLNVNFSFIEIYNCTTGIDLSGMRTSDTLRHILTVNCLTGIYTTKTKSSKTYISNSTFFSNQGPSEYFQIRVGSSGDLTIENSIIYNEFGYGLRASEYTTIFSSDYNLYYTGKLPIMLASPGRNDVLQQKPSFVDTANTNFQLATNSIAIDKGNPQSPYELEPSGGGGRVNMGYYGNTPFAAVKQIENIHKPQLSKGSSVYLNNHTLYTNREVSNVCITTVNGKRLFQKQCINLEAITLPLQNYPTGMYFIHGEDMNGKRIYTKRVLID